MKRIFVTLLLVFLLSSCKSEFDVFEDSAAEFAKSDGIITNEERLELFKTIESFSGDRSFNRLLTDAKPDEKKLEKFLKKKGYKLANPLTETSSNNTFVNVYVENSGSMNGYINGSTEFKAAIQDLLVLLKYEYGEEKIKVFFINSDIHPTNLSTDLAGFASALNTKSFKVGDTGSSNLNSVFKQVLSKTSKNTMSILISDCIYSIQGSKTQELLSNQKSLTKDAFLSKSKTEKLATTIVKLKSKYNGNYWDMNNKKTMLSSQPRPYYITIIGSDIAMTHFNSKIEINEEKVEGYESMFKLSTANTGDQLPYYSVVTTLSDSGRFRPIKSSSDSKSVRGIEGIEMNERSDNAFSFSVAVDFSDIPVENDYVVNASNYAITEGNFKVTNIQPYDKKVLSPMSANKIAKSSEIPTHIITLTATAKKYTDVTISLKKQIPAWVYATSTDDDTTGDALKAKTFGFKYLIEGIAEAYQTIAPSNNYFETTIKINP